MQGKQWDVIVVGAGHSGLVASGYLARAGLHVLLLDRRPVVGGLCVTEELFPGFRGNTVANSAHNLDPRVVVELELERHGLEFAYPDPSAFMAFQDGRAFVSHNDAGKRQAELEKFSRGDAEQYAGLINYISELARVLDVSFFEPPPTLAELASRLKTPEQEEAFAKLMFGSIADLVDEWLESEELKTTLVMTAINTNFAGPHTPGSPLTLLQRPLYHWSTEAAAEDGKFQSRFHHLGASRWVPLGGMGAITQALQRSATASGVEVRTEAEVERVLVSGGRATGVVLASGQELAATAVLMNVNPKHALLNLVSPSDLDPSFRRRVEGINMRGQAFKAHLALAALPRFVAAGDEAENEAFAKCGFRLAPNVAGMDRAFAEAQLGRWTSEHPMIWGAIPSALDPSLTPEGQHLMSLSVFYAPYDLAPGLDWEIERERLGRRVVEVVGQYVSNLDSILIGTHFLSPRDLERRFGLAGAQASHGDLMPLQYFGLRPLAGWSDYRTPVGGLYLCGVGTWPGNFVSGISGINASNAITSDLQDPEESMRRLAARLEATASASP